MSTIAYRDDIDGVRAFSVISVILFHLGYLKNGYLGVDVFFVISGFLITGIVYSEVLNDKFSVLKFYERRLRRIFPLVLFTTLTSLIIGYIVMLPDDFENLCQSVIASNFSANNILMFITSSNYWDIKNDFKPLMHTWSLGVEEQFYIIFPFIIYILSGRFRKYILHTLLLLALASILIFLYSTNTASKFYFIQYRFFELAFGGILSIMQINKAKIFNYFKAEYNLLFLGLLVVIIYFELPLSNDYLVILTTIISGLLLVSGGLFISYSKIYTLLLTNKPILFLGRISFSLYMWHQITFAFSRYFIFEELNMLIALLLIAITIILSILTYFFIENPFRNRQFISTKWLFTTITMTFILVNSFALYFYAKGGIVRDIPELNVTLTDSKLNSSLFNSTDNINIKYNEGARDFNSSFPNIGNQLNILVIGDSYGRDLINIFNELKVNKPLELSYLDIWKDPSDNPDIIQKGKRADFIFLAAMAEIPKSDFSKLCKYYSIDSSKVYYFGVKDFGISNGIFYTKLRRGFKCHLLRTNMKSGVSNLNEKLKRDWSYRYIDIISMIKDENGQVPVFTEDCKFISQDTKHLTQPGAKYLAKRLEGLLGKLLVD